MQQKRLVITAQNVIELLAKSLGHYLYFTSPLSCITDVQLKYL